MNAPYELANTMAARICGMPPAKIITAGAYNTPNTLIDPEQFKGLFEHEYTHTNLTLNCYLDYEAANDGGRDEPSSPEIITVCYALANGVDVLCLLDEDTVSDIEDAARAAMKAEAFECEMDRAADRYEDRMACA